MGILESLAQIRDELRGFVSTGFVKDRPEDSPAATPTKPDSKPLEFGVGVGLTPEQQAQAQKVVTAPQVKPEIEKLPGGVEGIKEFVAPFLTQEPVDEIIKAKDALVKGGMEPQRADLIARQFILEPRSIDPTTLTEDERKILAKRAFLDFGGKGLDIIGLVPFGAMGRLRRVDKIKDVLKTPEGAKTFEAATKAQDLESFLKTPEAAQLTKRGVMAEDIFRVAHQADTLTNPQIKELSSKVVKQEFRGDKLNLPANLQRNIESRLDALNLTTRKVRTFGEMMDAANELGTTPEKLLRDVTTKRITDAEVIALRNTINNSAEQIARLEKQLLTEPENSGIILPKIQAADEIINQSLKTLVRGGTEAGRAVVSFRILANKTLDADVWLTKAQRELGPQKVITPEIRSTIFKMIEDRDVLALSRFVQSLRTPSGIEKAITAWKAGLLTSPTTQLANLGGNTLNAALMTASDLVALPLDVLTSLVTGKRTIVFSPKTVGAKIWGLKKGALKAKKFFKTGIYETDILTKYDLPREINFKNKLLDGYTKAIFRTLGAGDVLFRQAAMSEALEKQAILIAKNEGLRGAVARGRIKQLLLEPSNEMILNAIDAAEYSTFQGKNILSDMVSAGKRSLAKVDPVTKKVDTGRQAALGLMELVAPFVRTPTNIAARIADFSPLGLLRAFEKVTGPGGRQKKVMEAFGKSATGTGIMWLGSYLHEKGIMTGNTPTDKSEREQFFAEGKQANALRVGDYWYQLNRVSPFGNILALGAEFNSLAKEQEGANLLAATAAAGVKGLTEQTFLKGISGGLKAITEPERSAGKFIQQGVASTVPSVIGRTARTIDPKLRVRESILDALKERLPKIREDLPELRDIFGEEVSVPGGKFNLLDPFSRKKAVNEPVLNEAKDIGVTIGLPSKNVYSNISLDAGEYGAYVRVQGKLLKKALEATLESPKYQALSKKDKADEFERVIRGVRFAVREALIPALMVKKYNLPEDTQPEVLIDLLQELNQHDKFKQADEKKQEAVLKKLLDRLQ